MRTPNIFDNLITQIDAALRTLLPAEKRSSLRGSPADTLAETTLSADERSHIAGLMRVNHSGEVCAQALYQGQALTAHHSHIKAQMAEAAKEEIDHLAWCEKRLAELKAKPSVFNPIWYSGSFILGAVAGLAGDKISLGFVAETEKQVASHLQKHIQIIPTEDKKTKAILEQMQTDEAQHAFAAIEAGAVDLPHGVTRLMNIVSKIMTKSSYYF